MLRNMKRAELLAHRSPWETMEFARARHRQTATLGMAMADLTITVANVAVTSSTVIDQTCLKANPPKAGVGITAGMVVYLSASNTWLAALAGGTAIQSGVSVVWGVALHAALTGQPLFVATGGQVTIGATVVLGGKYVLSHTAGLIAPFADLTTNDYVSELGLAVSTTVLDLSRLFASNTQHA